MKKTGIAASVLLCGVPLASQQVRNHRLEVQLVRPVLAAADFISRTSPAGISQLRRLAKDLQGQNKDSSLAQVAVPNFCFYQQLNPRLDGQSRGF